MLNGDISRCLDSFHEQPRHESVIAGLADHIRAVFSLETVEDMVSALHRSLLFSLHSNLLLLLEWKPCWYVVSRLTSGLKGSAFEQQWASRTLAALDDEMSPTSLKLTLELMRRIRKENLSLAQVQHCDVFLHQRHLFHAVVGCMEGISVGLPAVAEAVSSHGLFVVVHPMVELARCMRSSVPTTAWNISRCHGACHPTCGVSSWRASG